MRSGLRTALVVAVAVTGLAAQAIPAHAATAGGCSSVGIFHSVSGIDLTPSADDFYFKSWSMSCDTTAQAANGFYSISATGTTDSTDTCGLGTFNGSITGGSGPLGTLVGGSFSGVRTLTAIELTGTMQTQTGPTITFVAELASVPIGGACDPTALDTANPTHEQVFGTGSFVVVAL